MITHRLYTFIGLCGLSLLLGLTACSSSAHLIINSREHTLGIECRPGQLLEANIKKLADQNSTADSVFNPEELTQAFAQEQVRLDKIELIGAAGFKLKASIPVHHTLVADFVQYTEKDNTVRILLTTQNMKRFLQALPQESRDFMDMLMAPLFTGETMTPQEYEELIAAAYGKKIAAEMKTSVFKLVVDVPYPIQSASIRPIGTIERYAAKATRAAVFIPVAELLASKGPIEIRLQ